MFDIFSQGGPLFMGILTLILLSLVAVFVLSLIKKRDEKQLLQSIQWLKSLGTLGLVVGILGQLIGLFSAFSVIETSQGISPTMLVSGLKVSYDYHALWSNNFHYLYPILNDFEAS